MADQLDRLKEALSDRYAIEPELGSGGILNTEEAMFGARRDQVRRAIVAIALAVVTGACSETHDAVHEFALFGDSPYTPESVARVENLIDDVNERADLEWVIHVGDIKGGAQPCTGVVPV